MSNRKSVDELPSWVLELRAAWSSELEKVRRREHDDKPREDDLPRAALRASFASEKESTLQDLGDDFVAAKGTEEERISSFLQGLCREEAAGPSALQRIAVRGEEHDCCARVAVAVVGCAPNRPRRPCLHRVTSTSGSALVLTTRTTTQLMMSSQQALAQVDINLDNYVAMLEKTHTALDDELRTLALKRAELKAKVERRLKQLVSWGFAGTKTQSILEE